MIELIDNERKKKVIALSYLLTAINVLLVIILLLLLFVISPLTVKGDSMKETLHDGEHIFIQKIGYNIERGDIIVFEKDPVSEKRVVKRVIGIEGDLIKYDTVQKCYIRNGETLEENYVFEEYNDGYINATTDSFLQQLTSSGIVVKKDELFVLGDNRNISNDSHSYGCINKSQIIGKYLFRY